VAFVAVMFILGFCIIGQFLSMLMMCLKERLDRQMERHSRMVDRVGVSL